jgi:S1-C subfamily serine protease
MNVITARHPACTRATVLIASLCAAALAVVMAAGPAAAQQRPAGCPASVPELFERVSGAVLSISAISINPYDADRRVERVMGSGFIIDTTGLILTNSHVVFGRQVILVTLDDGTTLPAKFIGADPVFDIALIRIPPPTKGTLPVAQLGDSSKLLVGEDVFAIGNPLGLDQSLTRGIVSAMNRMLPGAAWSLTEPLIQTDAAINPGNSGGPLVDTCGQVIGINTANFPEAQNIGFAVPINLVRQVIPFLLERGRVIRPWLGVQGQFVAPELKELLRLPLVDGFLVEATDPGSPAERKGLQGGLFEITVNGQPVLLGGDIITELNGVAVAAPETLGRILGGLQVGSLVRLTFARGGKTETVEVTLEERPVMPWDGSRRSGAASPPAQAGAAGRLPGTGRTLFF